MCAGCPSELSRRAAILLTGFFGLLLLAVAQLKGQPLVVFNGSASAPLGFYLVLDRDIKRGDLVLVRPPSSIKKLIVERGYLPPNVPLIKRVAGLQGDRVCRENLLVSVNGKTAVAALESDQKGRPMPVWSGCRNLTKDEVFLLQDHPRSLDGRYFGPIERGHVIGILRPIWLLRSGPSLGGAVLKREFAQPWSNFR